MVRLVACVVAAAAVLPVAAGATAAAGAKPAFRGKPTLHDSPPPALPGSLVGYVSTMNGLSESSCYSTYPTAAGTCTLESFQQFALPTATPIAYGDRIIYQSASSTYPKTQYTSISHTLQNDSARAYSLQTDCQVPVYSPTLSYGAAQMPPRPVFATDPASGNNSLVPEPKDLQFQMLAFNSSDNYSLPNQTYFRVYDIDMSHPTECRSKEVGPDVQTQREMNLGAGYMRCAVRKDVIDNNVTGVVKSTHFALVAHDLSGTVCRGTDSRGYSESCLRLVSLTSYSNGTKGEVKVTDLTDYPYEISFATNTPCYYEPSHDAIVILGLKSYSSAIVRIDNVDSYYPSTTLVRTLDPSVPVTQNTLMNVDGNIGFLSGPNFLVYDVTGDRIANKTIGVIAAGTYSTLSYPVYAPYNRTV